MTYQDSIRQVELPKYRVKESKGECRAAPQDARVCISTWKRVLLCGPVGGKVEEWNFSDRHCDKRSEMAVKGRKKG
jgi:hypothetical protein